MNSLQIPPLSPHSTMVDEPVLALLMLALRRAGKALRGRAEARDEEAAEPEFKIAAPPPLTTALRRPKSLDSLCSLVHSLSPSLPVLRRSPAERNPRFSLKQPLRAVANDPRSLFPMLAAPAIDLTFDEDSDWLPPSNIRTRLSRTASVGNSWGVTSIGGGYSLSANQDALGNASLSHAPQEPEDERFVMPSGSFIEPDSSKGARALAVQPTNEALAPTSRSSTPGWPEPGWNDRHRGALTSEPVQCASPASRSPPRSSAVSLSITPDSMSLSINDDNGSRRPSMSRSPTMPRPRRRSSQQRVSLIAGRLSIVSIEPPAEQTLLAPTLKRYGSQSSFLSTVSSTEATPATERESFLGEKHISEFVVQGEIGRGAYGLVKRAREMNSDGTMGVSLIAFCDMKFV